MEYTLFKLIKQSDLDWLQSMGFVLSDDAKKCLKAPDSAIDEKEKRPEELKDMLWAYSWAYEIAPNWPRPGLAWVGLAEIDGLLCISANSLK